MKVKPTIKIKPSPVAIRAPAEKDAVEAFYKKFAGRENELLIRLWKDMRK